MDKLQNSIQEIGLRAVSFVVEDETLLPRFLDLSGLDLATLKEELGNDFMLAAVLDFLMQDESCLMTFSSNTGLSPDRIIAAHAQLSGRADEWQSI